MKPVTTFMQRRPLVAYFMLAFVLAWAFTPLIAISPLYGLPGLFAPALAGYIVSRVTGSPAQVSGYWNKLRIWRVNFVWYLLALGLPVVLSFFVAMLDRLLGSDPLLQMAPITPLSMIVFILVVGESLACCEGFGICPISSSPVCPIM